MNVYRLKLHRCYILGVKIIIWRGRIIAGGYNNYTGHERKERERLPLDKRHLAGAIIVVKGKKKKLCKLSRFSSFASRDYLNNNLQLFILQLYEILRSKLFFFFFLFCFLASLFFLTFLSARTRYSKASTNICITKLYTARG